MLLVLERERKEMEQQSKEEPREAEKTISRLVLKGAQFF